MHELSICRQIISQASDIGLQNRALAIESITLKIGPLSGIESELLKRAFPFAAEHTLAERANLVIDELPVVIQCRQCGSKTNTVANNLLCSQCGSLETMLLSGDEMILDSVELIKNENNEVNYV